MDAPTQAWIDRLEILQVLAAYCRGIDRVDVELMKSVYWEDGVDNHGDQFRGRGWDFAELACAHMPKAFNATSHRLGQTWFASLTETRALTETYFCSTHDPLDSALPVFSNHGRYVDVFEKRGRVWKILKREGIFDLRDPRVVGADRIEPGARRASDDVSYEVFTGPTAT